MNNPKTYVFFGNIGAGKGTQVELLQKVLEDNTGKKVVLGSSGNRYRELIALGGHTGLLVKTILDQGKLLPDFLTNGIFTSIIVSELDKNSHLICDGYPRTIYQSKFFIETMQFYSRNEIEIIYVDVSKDEAIRRIQLRARDDDTKEGIKNRFEEYENNVIPAMEYLEKEGFRIHKINGERSVEDVHGDIIKSLGL